MPRYFAVGDIHGHYIKLKKLLNCLDWKPNSDDLLIFLGDYIDRGPDSYQVVSRLVTLAKKASNVIPLLGNHEDDLLQIIKNKFIEERNYRNGIQATIESYHKHHYEIYNLPQRHLAFLNQLLPYYETEKYIFVHAGLMPGVPLAHQNLEDLLWVRDEFFRSNYDFGKLVVFGHTPFRKPFLTDRYLGIDTGAAYGKSLTCVVLPEMEFIAID